MNNSVGVVLISTTLLVGLAHAQDQPQTNLPRNLLTVGIHQIDTQLAVSPEQHAVGLMFRKEMPQHEGMMFIFQNSSQQCFWMKNTILALTATFRRIE